jgi:hypothetical protein
MHYFLDQFPPVVGIPLDGAIPPVLFELINCGLSAAAGIALLICLRYLAIMHWIEWQRADVGFFRAIYNLSSYRLAVGFTIFLIGEWPRVTWLWWARYTINHDVMDASFMGQMPWAMLPVVFGVVSIIGKACIIRALIPMAWGQYAYVAVCGGALAVVIASQFIRL